MLVALPLGDALAEPATAASGETTRLSLGKLATKLVELRMGGKTAVRGERGGEPKPICNSAGMESYIC